MPTSLFAADFQTVYDDANEPPAGRARHFLHLRTGEIRSSTS